MFQNSPLRHPVFSLFYSGCVCTALGYTMQGTLAAWLMATLSTSAVMVALVQTATAGPVLVLGLIAGFVADSMDRRRMILITQWVMLAAVLALSAMESTHHLTPAVLLSLTVLVGVGFAFYLPAQMASIQSMVTRAELPAASALNAVAFNAARAVGPAFAGALVIGLSAGSALLASAAFFMVTIAIVYLWQPGPQLLPGPTEGLLKGVQAGLRFAWHSQALRAVTARNVSFSFCASAFWALLPLIAKEQLRAGAGGFGLLFTAFGLGAIFGAWLTPALIRRTSLNATTNWGALVWAAAVAVVAWADWPSAIIGGAFVAGSAWVAVLSSLSAGTQSRAPTWMRARAVSIYIVGTQAGLAIGSAVWGTVASLIGVRLALLCSVGVLLVAYVLLRQLRIQPGTEADTLPNPSVAELSITHTPDPEDGPVLIQFEYHIDLVYQAEFVQAMDAVGPARRRSGASNWGVFRDLNDSSRFVERYVITSWADYLRQRERMTQADKLRHEKATRFQKANVPIKLSRFIGVEAGSLSGYKTIA